MGLGRMFKRLDKHALKTEKRKKKNAESFRHMQVNRILAKEKIKPSGMEMLKSFVSDKTAFSSQSAKELAASARCVDCDEPFSDGHAHQCKACKWFVCTGCAETDKHECEKAQTQEIDLVASAEKDKANESTN